MNEGSQLDLPSGPFPRPFHITMALFQLHQSIKMKRCRSICVNSGFFSKKIFLHVNGTYRLKNHVCMTRPFHITMAFFSLHQSIKMKRCWSLINLRIAVTLSFSEKIFLCVNGTYLAVTLHSLVKMIEDIIY